MDYIYDLTVLSISLYNRLIYSSNYACVDCTIDQVIFPKEIPINEIYEWISYERYHWKTERPPLQLYSKFLVLSQVITRFPDELLFDILKALNYYGNYRQVINIAEKNINNVNDFFLLAKHIGKAYKSLGFYNNALEYYRLAMSKAIKVKNIPIVAFFLILIGKLCDDYHQKKGMHRFYHKISYQKLNELGCNENFWKFPRVFEICADCYAKTIYSYDFHLGKTTYETIISQHTKYDEQKIRLELNYFITQAKYDIVDFREEKTFDILSLFYNIESLTEKLLSDFSNERAYAIRTTQLIMLYRKLFENLIEINYDTQNHDFLKKHTPDSILESLSISISICEKYNEFKFLSFSLLESVKWSAIQYRVNGTKIPNKTYNDWIEILHNAITSLTVSGNGSESKYLISDIYIDVLIELANIFVLTRRFGDALQIYQDIYEHFSFLLTDIKTDSDKIRKVIDGSNDYIISEYSFFNNTELYDLRTSLFLDYESLSDKLLKIGKEINALQYMDTLTFINDTIITSKSIDYHSLNRLINNIIGYIELSHDKNLIIANMREVENRIDEIRRTNDLLFEEEEFNVNQEANKYISSLEFKLLRGKIPSIDTKNEIIINYSKRYFSFILNSLIYNINETAEKLKLSTFTAEFNFTEIKNNNKKTVFIHIKDNVGNIEHFKNIIRYINENKYSEIIHDQNRGTGLKSIKKITVSGIPWSLNIDYASNIKELIIPLYQEYV